MIKVENSKVEMVGTGKQLLAEAVLVGCIVMDKMMEDGMSKYEALKMYKTILTQAMDEECK